MAKNKSNKKQSPFLRIIILIVVIGAFIETGVLLAPKISHTIDQQLSHFNSFDEPLNVKLPQVSLNYTSDTKKHDVAIPPVIDGLAPVISKLPTKEPVVFLGIDDGANKQDFELQLMIDNNVKASLFLANRFLDDKALFFKPFIGEGSLIENHTMHHKLLGSLNYDDQKEEICDEADLFTKLYGRRPILLRPPGGSYNQDTQKAAADCGMKAVVMWDAKANGGIMQYQHGHRLQPGDIVLMHFRPEFDKDMEAFLAAQKTAGLHTELLEDWL